ncbi:MAG: SDR family oxidoreductase [Rhizobacter sp.]|nr:SDR family oxidoreductase [Chlorobiales bacterium]
MKKLEGKVAVITGGNSGIGLSTAKEFQAEGAKVVISGRNQKTLDESVKAIGGETLAVQGDVSSLADIDKLIAKTKEKFGKIDILVVNAGIFKGAPVEATDESLYNEIMDINVKGAFFTIQKALPLFNDGGSIVIVSSVVNQIGMANASVYSASKAAVRSFARTLSADLAGRNIRVNVCSPGPIATPIFGRLGMPPEVEKQVLDGMASLPTLKRFGTPEEVAKVILFLASSDSSYMLGAEMVVAGGFGEV